MTRPSRRLSSCSLQKTDHEGVANFQTIFPGHYPGRTNHIHVMVHTDATEQPNGTVFGATASHIGMVYFDQDLINKVEANSVYKENKVKLTLNKDDDFLRRRRREDRLHPPSLLPTRKPAGRYQRQPD